MKNVLVASIIGLLFSGLACPVAFSQSTQNPYLNQGLKYDQNVQKKFEQNMQRMRQQQEEEARKMQQQEQQRSLQQQEYQNCESQAQAAYQNCKSQNPDGVCTVAMCQ